MNTKIKVVVKKVTEEEQSTGDRRGVVEFKGKGVRGTQSLKIFLEQDEAQEFQVGEEYELKLSQVKTEAA